MNGVHYQLIVYMLVVLLSSKEHNRQVSRKGTLHLE